MEERVHFVLWFGNNPHEKVTDHNTYEAKLEPFVFDQRPKMS